MSFDTAVDGSDALAHVNRVRYAVILVDLMMPRLDGVEFVSAMRGLPSLGVERPVVLMMTAAPLHHRAKSLGAEIQAVIHKPFDLKEVAEVLQGCVTAQRQHDERKRNGLPSDQTRLAEKVSSLSLNGR